MSAIEKVIEKFPEELRLPMYEALNIAIEESRTFIVREEINKVWEAIKELTEAQKKSEGRLSKLEEKMAELAEAQRKTEEKVSELTVALNKLTGVVADLKEEVGGISHTVGHILEDKAIVKLPKILKEEYGIEVEGKLKRGFLENRRGELEEINVYGFGRKDGEKVFIIGEGKARFGMKDLRMFEKKISRFGEKYGKPFPIIITYIFSKPEVEEKAKQLNFAYFLSYELEVL